MDIGKLLNVEGVDFRNIESKRFLLGLLSAFDNRYQASADSFFKEITWKQFFAIICIDICKESPTINELSEVMGSSHQNVKQILLKLEKVGFVEMIVDERDKRKQRVVITDKCREFCKRNDPSTRDIIEGIYDGIKEEDIITTIMTIIRMENNVTKIRV